MHLLSPPCYLQESAIAIDSTPKEDREARHRSGVRVRRLCLDLADTTHHDKDTKDSVRFKVGALQGTILLIICFGLWLLGGGPLAALIAMGWSLCSCLTILVCFGLPSGPVLCVPPQQGRQHGRSER